MVCKACNKPLFTNDLMIDDELCPKCLRSIEDSLSPETLDKLDTFSHIEGDNE